MSGMSQSERRKKSAGTKRPEPYDRPRFLLIVTGAVFVYLFAPIIVVIVFSFNRVRSLSVLNGLSLRWYAEALSDEGIRSSVVASLEIAVTVMVVAVVLGTLLALGMRFANGYLSRLSETLLLLTLVVPEIATGTAALLLFTTFGIGLGLKTVAVAQVTWSIVFATVIVKSRLSGLNPRLEEAAMDLGATRAQAVRLVILPQLWPSIIASCLLVFVFSWDNFVTAYFTSGIGVSPLPVRIYAMIKFGVSPTINALGTSMLALTIGIALVAVLVLRRQSGSRKRNCEVEDT